MQETGKEDFYRYIVSRLFRYRDGSLKHCSSQQAVVRAKAQRTPSPCCASRGFSELTKNNQVFPWSLHTFPENFMQIGPAVFS